MTRTSSYVGSPKTITVTAVQTLTWTSSEIDSSGVIAFHLSLQPVANDLTDIDRVRVRAAGQVILEATVDQLRAFQQRFARNNLADPTSGNVLTIPLNLLDGPTQEARDQCQFPAGAEAQVEVVTLNTTAAGTAVLSWDVTKQEPRFFQRLISQSGNMPASTPNAKFTFSESGIVRGIIFATAGVARAELTISGQRAWNLPGPQFQALAYGDLLTAKDAMEDGNTATTSRCHSVDLNLPAASGVSNLVLDTGVGWAGVTNEVCVYSVDRMENFRA